MQCQGLPLAFWKDVKEFHYWFLRLVRFNFLSYCHALLIEMKGSLEASERRAMSVCLLPRARLPWSLCQALGPLLVSKWQSGSAHLGVAVPDLHGVGSGWQRTLGLPLVVHQADPL